MREDRFLFYNDGNGKWEFYDSTYDITIHCKNQQEMENASEILRKYGTDEKAPNASFADPVDMAIAIMKYCESRTGGGGCCFEKETSSDGDAECRLNCPENWDFEEV